MRILLPVCAVVAVGAGVLSAVLWRGLGAERQQNQELRAQLEEARTALARRPVQMTPVVIGPAAAETPAAVAAEPPARVSREEAMAVVAADVGKTQKKLLEDPQYRKARIEQARLRLKQRYAGLAEDLGLSEREMNALLDLLAGQQISAEGMAADLMASGATPDAAAMAEITRMQAEMQQKEKDALVAMLGESRYEEFRDYEMTQPSRQRVSNLTTLLANGGRPLTDAQKRSLTAVIVAEQKRQQNEAQSLRESGQNAQASQQDRAGDGNRRILEAAAAFLDPQQLELIRGRFQQRSAADRAAGQIQQRVIEAAQEGNN